MKKKFFIFACAVFAVSLIAYSQFKTENFAPAADFPRGALIYVQVEDLPAFIKLWNESEVKKNYLESRNFSDFSNAHLGRKLASRRREFNDAAGFDFDLETIAGLSQNRAAVALYDVGKLEFVFIAPVSGEVFAATKFMQNSEKFTAERFDDGTEFYRVKVEADRGRQKQELLFTHIKDRLIVVTSEKLLAQTFRNINGEKSKNRLIDEPDFAAIKNKMTTHTASVWLDQTALNDDYYFRRYWLMSDIENLKNIRAGIFDFEIAEDKFIERRNFLLKENEHLAPIDAKTAENILQFAPENSPFYQLKTATAKTLDEAVRKTIFSRRATRDEISQLHYINYSSGDDDYGSNYYETPGEKFDEAIDDDEDDFQTPEDATTIDFSNAFRQANARAVLTFNEPKILPAPLFVDFRHTAVFSLNAPQSFNRENFETAIAAEFLKNSTVRNSGVRLIWKTVSANVSSFRRLDLPMIGSTVNYDLNGENLILTDFENFSGEIIKVENQRKSESEFAELAVINLTERENAFENVFTEIEKNNDENNFFTGNISSLLDSAKDIKKIEIRKKYLENRLEEELIFYK